MGRQAPKVGVIPTPEEHKALLEWAREWEEMQRQTAKRFAKGDVPSSPPPANQQIAPFMLDTWGKSLQSLFANKDAGDILPRFTVDHMANLNSPFYQALQKRRGEPMASIQPFPNPSAMSTPQGMLPEDMISLYALGFRDSLMRVSPILGSRGIPIFENLMNAPIVEEKPSAPAPKPAPAPAPAPKPAPAPVPTFEGKGLSHNEANAIWRKYGVPTSFQSYVPFGEKPMVELEEFDWAMRTGNVKRARELFNQMWGKDPVYMTPSQQSALADFRSRMRERFLQMEIEQLRRQMAG